MRGAATGCRLNVLFQRPCHDKKNNLFKNLYKIIYFSTCGAGRSLLHSRSRPNVFRTGTAETKIFILQ